MSVIYTSESEFGKEMRKWEPTPEQLAERMVHPAPYPAMLYKGKRSEGGPITYETMIVASPDERDRMASRGWCTHPDEAIEAYKQQDLAVAKAAAHRAYEDRGLSEAAQREVRAYEATTDEHVPEIPRTPIKRRHRAVKKVVPVLE